MTAPNTEPQGQDEPEQLHLETVLIPFPDCETPEEVGRYLQSELREWIATFSQYAHDGEWPPDAETTLFNLSEIVLGLGQLLRTGERPEVNDFSREPHNVKRLVRLLAYAQSDTCGENGDYYGRCIRLALERAVDQEEPEPQRPEEPQPEAEDPEQETDSPAPREGKTVLLQILAADEREMSPEDALQWLRDIAPELIRVLWSTRKAEPKCGWRIALDLERMILGCTDSIASQRPLIMNTEHVVDGLDYPLATRDIADLLTLQVFEDGWPESVDGFVYLAECLAERISVVGDESEGEAA